ncbi:hypothetical protein [Mariniphaga sp.]|uniref:hypothetical protein n=1 Tax=Mariniphaga sp. TaxID=1954475 RepID=UPI0035628B00
MNSKINIESLNWWFWFISLVFIVAAIAGWTPGYYLTMILSLLNLLNCLLKEKSLIAFPSQIRFVYFAVTLLSFWPGGRFYVYILLLVGTFMVTFLGKCSIALALKQMPWNKRREMRLD